MGHTARRPACQLGDSGRSDDQSPPCVLVDLPWPLLSQLHTIVLRSLRLPEVVAVSTSSSEGSATPTPPLLPLLKHLTLHACQFNSADCLVQLAGSSSALTCLQLAGAKFANKSHKQQHKSLTAAVLSVLKGQKQLQVLQLGACSWLATRPVSSDAIKCLAEMPALRDLSLTVQDNASCRVLAGCLPSTLTSLQLHDHRDYNETEAAGDNSIPTFYSSTLQPQQLSNLLHLRLSDCWLFASALRSMPQLQTLAMSSITLMPNGYWRTAPADVSALLDGIATLKHLRRFEITGTPIPEPERWERTDAYLQRFSALTLASEHLSALVLSGAPRRFPPLFRGVVQHMFPEGRQLPALRHLVFTSQQYADEDYRQYFSGQDLGSIINCSPNLQSLDIGGIVQPNADVSALARLPQSCVSLTVGGSPLDAYMGVLTQLTHLTRLDFLSCNMTGKALQKLTVLQGLRELYVAPTNQRDELMCRIRGNLRFVESVRHVSRDGWVGMG